MATSLIRRAGIYLVGTASTKLIQFALIPVYAIYVAPDSLGRYDYWLTIATIISVVAFGAIWEAVLRFSMGSDRLVERADVLSVAAGLCVRVAPLVVLVSGVLAVLLPDLLTPILLVGGMVAASGVALVWQYAARSLGLTKLFVVSGVVSALVVLIGTWLLSAVIPAGAFGLSMAYILSQVAVVAILEPRVHMFRGVGAAGESRSGVAKRMLRFSLPLVINLVSMLLLIGFGRLIITNWIGPGANGEYVFAMKVAGLLSALGSVLSMASIEESVTRIGDHQFAEFFARFLRGAWLCAAGVAGVVLGVSEVVFSLVVDTQYAGSARLIGPLVLFAAFNLLSTGYANAFQVSETTRITGVTTAIGLVVTVALSLWLVGAFGTEGVAWSLCVGMAVVLVLRLVGASLVLHERPAIVVPLLVVCLLLGWVMILRLVGGLPISYLWGVGVCATGVFGALLWRGLHLLAR